MEIYIQNIITIFYILLTFYFFIVTMLQKKRKGEYNYKNKLIAIFIILLSLLCVQSFVYAEEGTSTNSTWTDFSKANYEISYRTNHAELSVSNITPIINEGHSYYYLITASKTKPSFDFKDYAHNLDIISTNDITSYLELNQDLYLWVVETNSNNEHNFVVEGKKLDRPEYPKYNNVFSSILFSSENYSQLTFMYHGHLITLEK